MPSGVSSAGTSVAVACSEGLAFGLMSSTCRGARYETLVLKATYELVPYGPPRLVSPERVVLRDVPRSADPRSSVVSASEAAPFLPNAAVVMSGFAHPPNTAPTAPFAVRLALFATGGPLVDKYLQVVSETGAPVPLVYEEAVARADNPAGSPRPHITDPRNPEAPIGVGPIATTWPSRAQLLRGGPAPQLAAGLVDLGTGVDGRFFNPAPLDQQTRPLDGSETLVLEGVDPERPRWTTHLGGASATATLSMGASAAQPIRLSMDMLVIDAVRRRFSLVWRAFLPLPMEDAGAVVARVEAALQGSNAARARPSEVPPGASAVGRSLNSTVDTTSEMLAAPRGPALPFGAAQPRPPAAAPIAPPASVPASARPHKPSKLDQTLDPAEASMLASAMPFAGGARPSAQAPDVREAQAAIPATPYEQAYASKEVVPARRVKTTLINSSLEALREAHSPSPPALVSPPPLVSPPALVSPPPPQLRYPVEQSAAPSPSDPASAPAPALVASEPAAPPEEPAPPAPAPAPIDDRGDPKRASVLERLARGASLRDMPLAGANLSDLDLSRQSLTGSTLHGALLTKTLLAGANLAGVSLAGANLQGATLSEADLGGAILTGAVLEGASFAGANLVRADLSKARARGADFTGAKLESAILVQFDGERANLSRADLSRANAERAIFTDANLEGVTAKEANFERASLVKARLSGANLAKARLGKASFDEAALDGADLGGADLVQCAGPDARFDGANLENANLRQARLENASFAKAMLHGANLGRADLTRARLGGADLSGVDARGAKLVQADLRSAKLHETDFRDGDLTGALTEGADMATAKLKGAKPPKAT